MVIMAKLVQHTCDYKHASYIQVEDGFSSKYTHFYICRLLFLCYMLYLMCFTVALVLAAKSSDPRQYNSVNDDIRLFFEITSLLYILSVIILDTIIIL